MWSRGWGVGRGGDKSSLPSRMSQSRLWIWVGSGRESGLLNELSGGFFRGVRRSCSRFVDYRQYLCGDHGDLAGVRFSPDLKPVTLTTTRTGLRSPVHTSSDTASVMVALKRPVRRCFGIACSIPVRLSLKPMSSNRSASSMMRISRDFMFKGEE